MADNRIEYIDVMKGIGILLVVLGHSIGWMSESFYPVILSFHMPLFFFVTGLIYGTKGVHGSLNQLFKKKSKTLLTPLVFIWVVTILKRAIMQIITDHSLSIRELGLLHSDGGWFLVVMFLTQILFTIVLIHSRRKTLAIWVLLIFSTIAFISCSFEKIKYIQQTLAAIVFCCAGYLIKPLAVKYDHSFKIKGAGIILLVLTALLSFQNEPIGMYDNTYGNKYLFLLTAIIGILAMIDISMLTSTSKVLRYFGRNSLVVYATHFQIVVFVKRLFATLSVPLIPTYLIVFFLVILIEIPIIELIRRWCPWILGMEKSKVKQQI